jgi:mono/diheme cytochrome c family protein
MFRLEFRKTIIISVLIPLFLIVISACGEEGRPVKGFVLPEGDIAQGEQVFIDFKCHGCHTIPGLEFPEVDFTPPFILEIGGEVYRVKNYGELLTAVVYPDHVISRPYIALTSPMPYFGDEMTVSELIDLVAFLHAQYTKLQPKYYPEY